MKKTHDFFINNAVSVALFMFAIVVFSYLLNFHRHYFSDNTGDWGTFGDFVGGTLNPFLSFLALVILLRTFSMQRKELSLQRKELKKTKALLKKQTQTQVKQQFESTFFSLLTVHNQLLSEITEKPIPKKTDPANPELHGESTAKIINSVNKKWDEINNQSKLEKMIFDTNYLYNNDDGGFEDIQSLEISYNELIKNVVYYTNYFHILFELLKFIKKLNLEQNELVYANIVKSTLNNSVLRLLVIYAHKNEEYRKLIERYSIFETASFNPKNVDNDEFPAVLEASRFYDSKVFGQSQ